MTVHRWIELEGAFNVRDLGGLETATGATRGGVLLRADNLDRLTPEDVRRLTSEHRVRAVVDLRNAVESAGPPEWARLAGVAYHHVPLFDLSGETMAAVGEDLRRDVRCAYRRMLEMAGPAIAQVLEVIVDDRGERPGPVVVHCAAGKDRTGIVVAVLLSAVGVGDDAVVADYLATAERIDAVRASLRLRELYRPPAGAAPLPVVTAEPIEAVLAALRAEAGGVRGYLARWGVAPERVDRLTRLLLSRP